MNLVRISAALRRQVRERASERCEYCLLAELKAFFPHEPDHIIAQKHGGRSVLNNLALACFDCNRFKGSDIASVDPDSGVITPLFNPRVDHWTEHFRLDRGRIIPLSAVGRTTERLLRLNLSHRVEIRRLARA
jgi:HNH endonuclease